MQSAFVTSEETTLGSVVTIKETTSRRESIDSTENFSESFIVNPTRSSEILEAISEEMFQRDK